MGYPDDSRDIKRGAEPVFTIRAQDALAIPALKHYADMAEAFGLDDQAENVRGRVEQFQQWQNTNRDHTKLPRYGGGMKETR